MQTKSCKAGYASAPPKWMGGVKPSTKQANAHFSGGYTGINTNHPVTHDGIVSTMYIVHNTGKKSHSKGTAKKDLVNVRTQVWRKVGSKFNLVGESQALTFKKGDNEVLRKVKLHKSILVKKGDFFGFYSGNPSSSSGDEGNHVQLWGIRDTSGGSAMYAHGRKTGSGNSFSSGGKVTYRVGGVLDGDVCACFATLNPYLDSGGSFSEGNLVWDSAKLGDGYNALSTVSLNGRGKTYCEVSVDNKKSSHEHIGVFGRFVKSNAFGTY